MTGGCLLCEMEQAAPSAVVFRDELWAAEVAPGYEVPGWFFLRVRRHAERLTGLDDAELSALGHRARDLVAAVTDATAAPGWEAVADHALDWAAKHARTTTRT